MEFSDSSEVLRRTCKAIEDSFWTKLLHRPIFKGYAEKHTHKCNQCGQTLECFDHYCELSSGFAMRKICPDCSNALVGHTQYHYIVDDGKYAEILAEKIRLADKAIAKEKKAKGIKA